MSEPKLEDVVKRLADLEIEVALIRGKPPSKDWRRTVGMFEDSEFMAEVDAEVLASREKEREAARNGSSE